MKITWVCKAKSGCVFLIAYYFGRKGHYGRDEETEKYISDAVVV